MQFCEKQADRVKCSICLILGCNSNGNDDRWGDTLEDFHGDDDGEGDYHGDNSRDGYNSGGGMATAMAKAMEMTTKIVPSPLPSTRPSPITSLSPMPFSDIKCHKVIYFSE